MVIILSY